MPKTKYRARCQNCGFETPKWLGRCPDCGEWNTFVEEAFSESKTNRHLAVSAEDFLTMPLSELSMPETIRQTSGIAEFDRVLGGGFVPGGLVLIGGEPGIGKSTLLLQVAAGFAAKSKQTVMLISGEESSSQIKMRAERLHAIHEKVMVLSATDLVHIQSEIDRINPALLIVDSIQTVFNPEITSSPGSVSQVRECTATLLYIAKQKSLPVCITGHVTKAGAIAGPRVLEHIVDVVLYFEGDRFQSHRIVRAVKNRYGSTNEVGIFEMTDHGLDPVDNPSAMFLGGAMESAVSGAAVLATIEGTRSMLVEVQSLATTSYLNMPRRLASGFDYNRLLLIIAILERRAGLRFDKADVYINTTGGLRVTEPGGDLGAALAAASALRETGLGRDTVCFGELSLSGEIRPIGGAALRIKEAERLGFSKVVMSARQTKDIPKTSVQLIKVADIAGTLTALNI